MKLSKAAVEHYVIALAVSAIAIWQTGNHHLKTVAWSAVIAVLGPVADAAYKHFKTEAAAPVPTTK